MWGKMRQNFPVATYTPVGLKLVFAGAQGQVQTMELLRLDLCRLSAHFKESK